MFVTRTGQRWVTFTAMRLGMLLQYCLRCINTVTDCCWLSTLTVYFSPKMWYQALENYLPTQNKSIKFISLNGALLYKYVCFPTVSLFFNLPEVKHVKMHRNKRGKNSLDPFFRSRLLQKIVLRRFVIRCFPSQPAKIDADVLSFVLHCTLSISIDGCSSHSTNETMLEQGKIKTL